MDVDNETAKEGFYGLLNDPTSDEPYKFTQDLSYEVFVLTDSDYDKSEKRVIYDKLYKDALLKKAVDIPVDDGLSEWRDVEDSTLEDLDKSLDVKDTFIQASKIARKYGEVLILPVLVSKLNKKLIKIPLSYSMEKTISEYSNVEVLKLIVLDEFTSDEQLETDICSDNWGKPKWFRYENGKRNVKIHPSRVLHIKNTSDGCSFIDSVLPYFEHFIIRNQETTRAVQESNWIILKTDFKRIQQEISARLGIVTTSSNIAATKDIIKSKVEEGIKSRLQHMRANSHNSSAYAIDMNFEDIDMIKKDNIDQMDGAAKSSLHLIAGAADVPTERFLGSRSAGMGSAGSTVHYIQFLSGFRSKLIENPLERLDKFLQLVYPSIKDVSFTWNPTLIEQIENSKDRTPMERETNPGGLQNEQNQ